MQPNEIIREYLAGELQQEESTPLSSAKLINLKSIEQRQLNRNQVDKAVRREEENVESQDPEIEEGRRKASAEFWEETRKTHGADVLNEMRSTNVPNAIQTLEENLDQASQRAIMECIENEMELADQLQQIHEEEEREDTGNFNIQEDAEEYNEAEDDEEEEEQHHHEQGGSEYQHSENQSVEHYRTSEHPEGSEEDQREYDQGHSSRPLRVEDSGEKSMKIRDTQGHSIERITYVNQSSLSPQRGGYFYPRYINKREKMEMLMKNPAFVQVNKEIASPIAEKRVEEYRSNRSAQDSNFRLEPHSNIPEERGFKNAEEQPFIEEYDLDMPRKLKVSMTTAIAPDIDEANYPEPWYNKSKFEESKIATNRSGMNKSGLTKGYPFESVFDEKSFIKKNLDNYQNFEPEDPNHFAKDVFADLKISPGFENDVILERLKQRYEAVYRDNFLLDRTEMKLTERNKRKPVHLPDNPYLSEEHMKESKLLATLKSPELANDLRQLEEPSPLSESFQEYKLLNSPKKYSMSPNKREYIVDENKPKRGKSRSPEKRSLPIYEQFERELAEFALPDSRSAYQGANSATKEISSASTHKSFYLHRPKKMLNLEQLEDFILDFYRTLSSNNGNVPAKHQLKLQEILNLKPTTNKYFELRKTVYNRGETERNENENSPDRGSEENLVAEILAASAQELNNKILDNLKPHPDKRLRTLFWQCLMALLANFDPSIEVINQHVTVKYDRVQQFSSQPGKALLGLRALPKKIKTGEIKKTLYDDFINFYIELEDELIKGKLENENERQFLRYLYFAKRYIEVLDREEKLNVINNAGQRIATNARMNQKYLENAERRRLMNAEARQTAVQDPNQDMYGIDFKKWEENLKEIERENKLIVKFNEQKKRKEEKKEKEEEKKKLKEDEIKEYNEYHERSKREKKEREELRKQEIEHKRTYIHERISAIKERKQEKKVVEKEQNAEVFKKTKEDIEYRNQQKLRLKDELKQQQQARLTKLKEDKQAKIAEKQVVNQVNKEEQAWKKAQELFDMQRRLLQERDKLAQSLKSGKS